MNITWLGHSAVHLRTEERSILIDPFFTGNPKFPQDWEKGLDRLDAIVLTHGHSDHMGEDAVRLARAFDAVLVAQFEICMYLNGKGVEKFQPMNTGGTVDDGGVLYSMVPAFHSSAIMEDGKPVTMGDPAGFVIRTGGHSIYHAGDTCLFSDMALVQRLYQPKVGFLPVGDRFTMGPEQAAIACNEFLDLDVAIPVHWGTFDLLTGDPRVFRDKVTRGRVEILEPGGSIEV
ncbi:MAG: metal-dependent hydrolase [Geminicoccaceae bacterium]|nr:metal-dependent hydrolase [Geminicoccaceae bacterium]MCB9942226.1 metal-dependent hydrolase [Geminicoccaceae bacterium]